MVVLVVISVSADDDGSACGSGICDSSSVGGDGTDCDDGIAFGNGNSGRGRA